MLDSRFEQPRGLVKKSKFVFAGIMSSVLVKLLSMVG